jgi:hypothetical protein
MTTRALERRDGQGVPAIGGRWRPTSAVSGGESGPSGDGRVQQLLPEVGAGSVAREAVLSRCGAYRYTLTRRWGSGPRAVFVGLNPSTADAENDDASTRRMVGFARSAGCGSLTLVNLYAWRSTSPAVLRHVSDPVGADTDDWITRAGAIADAVVIAAWGTHAEPARAAAVMQLLPCTTVWCLGETKDGHPRHPLYVASRTALQIFRPAAHDWSEWSAATGTGLPEPLRERFCAACGLGEVDVDHQVDIHHREGRWS